MPKPPRTYPVFACSRCACMFTIEWVPASSAEEYNLEWVDCPQCNTMLRRSSLATIGKTLNSFEVGQDPWKVAKFRRKPADSVIGATPRKVTTRVSASARKPAAPQKATTRVSVSAQEPVSPRKATARVSVSAEKPAAPRKAITPMTPDQVSKAVTCAPLMEACTLELYQKNIFRITGLPVDASPKDVAKQAQRLQMLEEMGGASHAAFPLIPPPTADQIREALARMKEPEHRLIDELFWYWPEKFGSSKEDEAIQAVLAGDGAKAFEIWVEREQFGNSPVARHNLAVLFHMYAVDWTNHHVTYDIDEGRDQKIKTYWRDACDRWEYLVGADAPWDMLKDRVRSLEDHALTTGFVRRVRQLLPQALDRVNAEAALKFAEQGRTDWAEFHVDVMRQTHQGLDDVESTAELILEPTRRRLKQQLSSAKEQSAKNPSNGPQIATELMTRCKAWMELYDLFHGSESDQRNDLFDEVAELVHEILGKYRKGPHNDETIAALLRKALAFASGLGVREDLAKAIEVVTGAISFDKLKPVFDQLAAISKSGKEPAQMLEEVARKILPLLPGLATQHGSRSDAFVNLSDSVAILLRNISVEAHNEYFDHVTAEKAVQLAVRLAIDDDLKERLRGDVRALAESRQNQTCCICNVAKPDPSCTLVMPVALMTPEMRSKLPAEIIRKGVLKAPRCRSCKDRQERGATSSGSGCCVMLASIASFAALIILCLTRYW